MAARETDTGSGMRSLDAILHQFRDQGSVTMLCLDDIITLVSGIERTRAAVDLERHRVKVLTAANAELKKQELADARTIVELQQENADLQLYINNQPWT